jgi:hypothetical protein
MAMPIDIGTRAENGKILFFRPVGVPKFMCSVKMFLSGNVNHVMSGLRHKSKKNRGLSAILSESKLA